jgi:gas vesicle protein
MHIDDNNDYTQDYRFSDSHHHEGSTFLFGFAMGLVGGAAAALLYAPSEGKRMRSYLYDQAKDSRRKASAAAERGREMFNEGKQAVDQGREIISSAIQEGREAYRRTKDRHAV